MTTPRHVTASDVIAVLTFPHIEGAERAFADVRETARGAAWLEQVAFVEVHRHQRIVVRGTFAGHYLDVDDAGDVIGHDTAVGALSGALVGLAFGPPGIAVGLVGGGIAGGVEESHHRLPTLDGELYDEIRADVPEGSSAIVALAPPGDADAVVAAFEGTGGRVVRHELSLAVAEALDRMLADAPPASSL